MPADLLSELKKLQYQRSESSPFASHVEFNTWADKVLPLLSFDQKFYNRFKTMVSATNSARHFNIAQQEIENINSAIGIVNQAIASLEVMPVHNPATNPAKDPADAPKNPLSTLHIDTFKTVFGGLVLACLIYLLYTHFGLKLN